MPNTSACGRFGHVVINNTTGSIEAIRHHCKSWSCERCAPLLVATTRDLLLPQLVENEMRHFCTLTLSSDDRTKPLPEQVKRLKYLWSRIVDKCASLYAPTPFIYRKYASKSTTSKGRDSSAYWQQRYEKQCLTEREQAVLYDAFMELFIKAHGKQAFSINSNTSRSRKARALKTWYGMIRDDNRVQAERKQVESRYAYSIARMSVSNGIPSYYGTFELHADKATAHLHTMTDIYLSHYACHCVVYGKSVVKQRLKNFLKGEFSSLPFDWVYQCLDLSNAANHRQVDELIDEDFAYAEAKEVDQEADEDMYRVLNYVMKTIQYMTKDMGTPLDVLGLRSPDIHSRNIQARVETEEGQGKYTVLADFVPMDMPVSRVILDEALRGIDLSQAESDPDMFRGMVQVAVNRAMDNHPMNWEAFRIHENVLGIITYCDAFLPLQGQRIHRSLQKRVDQGEELNEQEHAKYRRLKATMKRQLENLKVSSLTPILLKRFNAPQLPIPTDFSALDSSQQRAIKQFCTNSVTVVTGPAGTGKSYVIRNVCERLALPPESTLIAARNGKAVARLNEVLVGTPYEAKTIHRTLYATMDGRFALDEWHTLAQYRNVIIDEIGTVDKPLLCSLLRALNPNTKVLMVGDAQQLPPIDSGSPLAELIEWGELPIVELSTQHRSNDVVLELAHAVLDENIEPLLDILVDCSDDNVQSLHNQGYQIITNSLGMTEHVNRLMQNTSGVRYGLYNYVEGDHVINLRNDYAQSVYNGDMGQVISATPSEIVVEVSSGRTVTYLPRQAMSLSLAYCLTAHRAQGSEYGKVAVILDIQSARRLLTNQWLYTAITRAKSDVRLLIAPKPRDSTKVLQRVLTARTRLVDVHSFSNAERVAKWMLRRQIEEEVPIKFFLYEIAPKKE